MARLRKTLPKDFREIIESGDIDAMKAVFDRCELDAREGYSKVPALSYFGIPDELTRWLVERGADVNAADRYEQTALFEQSSSWCGNPALLIELGADVHARDYMGATALFMAGRHLEHTRTLIAAGAEVNASDVSGDTALMYQLRRCSNSDLADAVPVFAELIDAGARITEQMRAQVRNIGEQFESARDRFDPESVAAADAALTRLYRLFGVDAAPAHVRHDGVSPIELPTGTWSEQFAAAWRYLVPPMGAADTVQGEAVRVSGRVFDEVYNNGAANWDRGFQAMLTALVGYLHSGTPLSAAELDEVDALVSGLRGGDGDLAELDRLRELTIRWVGSNPSPISLAEPTYRR